MANESSKAVPPYVTWGVFKGTIDTLAETTVPSGPLDRRVLHWLSGADHGALMSALRFLDLADAQNRATSRYDELIEEVKSPVGTEQFREKLTALLDEKYKKILERVDLERGTISELEKAFREEMEVAPGQMMTKTTRFFIKAYTEGGGLTIMSPHITRPKPKKRAAAKSPGAEKTSKRVTPKDTADDHQRTVRDVVPSGFERLPIPGMASAFIQYPLDLSVAQCALLEGAIAFLKIYAGKSSTGAKEAAK